MLERGLKQKNFIHAGPVNVNKYAAACIKQEVGEKGQIHFKWM